MELFQPEGNTFEKYAKLTRYVYKIVFVKEKIIIHQIIICQYRGQRILLSAFYNYLFLCLTN